MKMLASAFALGCLVLSGPVLAQTETDAQSPMGHMMAVMDSAMTDMKSMETSGNYDADFLMMMILHHQSAIEMAQLQLANGTDPEARAFAEKVIAAQTAEIAEIREMLKKMGVEAPAN